MAKETLEEYKRMPAPSPTDVMARMDLVEKQERLIRKLEQDIQREWNKRSSNHWSRDFDDLGNRLKPPASLTPLTPRIVAPNNTDEAVKGAIEALRAKLPKAGRGEVADELASGGEFGLKKTACSRRFNIDPGCRFKFDLGPIAAF